MHPDLHRYRDFPRHAGGAAFARARPPAAWAVVSALGGDHRYYALDALWSLREWMDAAVGGEGRVRRRPDRALRPGDRIDSWTVLAAEPDRRLALVFGMKAPGRGVLEFLIDPAGAGCCVQATAWWDPDGIAGHLYWRAMQPAHLILFGRLTAEIARRAEARDPAQADPISHAAQNSTA